MLVIWCGQSGNLAEEQKLQKKDIDVCYILIIVKSIQTAMRKYRKGGEAKTNRYDEPHSLGWVWDFEQ